MSNTEFVAKVVVEPDFSRFGPQLEQGVLQQSQIVEQNVQKPVSPVDDYAKSLSLNAQGKLDQAAKAAAQGYLKEVQGAILDLEALSATSSEAIQGQIKIQLVQLQAIKQEIEVALAAGQQQTNNVLNRVLHGGGTGGFGERGIGELTRGLPLASLGLRFGAIGIGVTAAFEAVGHLTEALKVDGEEAFTTEGKLRNMGAAILSADVIGAFQALTAHEKSSSEQLKELKKDAGTTAVDLRNLGQEAGASASKFEQGAALYKASGQGATLAGEAIQKLAEEERGAANDALALANALETSVTAANDVATAMRLAGSEAAAFGERSSELGRGPGAIDRENGRPGVGGLDTVDDSATSDSANSIRASIASRTKQLNDDLAVAEKAERDARRKFNNLKAQGIVEGAQDEYAKVVAATTKVAQIQNQLKAQQDAAAKQAKNDREREANDAQSAYAQSIRNQETRLSLAADAAGNTGAAEARLRAFLRQEANDRRLTEEERLRYAGELQTVTQSAYALEVRTQESRLSQAAEAADRRGVAEAKLLAFLKKEANDSRLSAAERSRYANELISEKKTATAALAAAAKADIDYRLALDRLNIQKADLTPGVEDNLKAEDKYIADLDKLIKAARRRGDKLEALRLEGEKVSAQLAKANLVGSSGGGFSLQDLFKTSVEQFTTFGSNIAGRDGLLSPQDARAQFGRDTAQSILEQLGTASLTESQKQTAILASIDAKVSTTGPQAAKRRVVSEAGNFGGWRAAQEAARYAYGSG